MCYVRVNVPVMNVGAKKAWRWQDWACCCVCRFYSRLLELRRRIKATSFPIYPTTAPPPTTWDAFGTNCSPCTPVPPNHRVQPLELTSVTTTSNLDPFDGVFLRVKRYNPLH